MRIPSVVAVTAIAVLAGGTVAATGVAPSAEAAKTVDRVSVVSTSLGGDRLTPKPSLPITPLAGAQPDIRVDASHQYQAIDGFGATFNEAGWATLTKPSVSQAQRNSVLTELFNPSAGAGFSIERTPIGSDDFSLSHYSYDETAGDFSLNDFSVDQDKQTLIPYIKAAQAAGGSFRLMASPWTAPSWMKKNDSLLGQPGDPTVVEPSTDPRYYQAYADYFAKYVAAYKAQGIDVTDVSVQNEPENPAKFEATTWNDSQMADFVGNYLGPDLKDSARIRVYEHNQDHWWYPAHVLNNPTAKQYAAGADFHPYECDFGQNYCDDANLDLFNQAAPGYSTWMSEHTDLGQAEPSNYLRDEKWSSEIVKQMNHGEGAYIYWNMVLDQNGGPVTDLSAPQEPLVEVDTSVSPATMSYMPKFYELAQFSKFVRPGAHRISAAGGTSGGNVAQTAFENADGSRVLVVVNSGPATSLRVGEGSTGFKTSLAAHSTTTFTWGGPKNTFSIDTGSHSAWTDVAGEHFTADAQVSGGTTATTTADIANTADDKLYQTTRDGSFTYTLPVPDGDYKVQLLLSDNTSTAAGQRVFDVKAEGATRLSKVDPYALAGAGKTATSASFDVAATGGSLSISTVAVTGTPTIAGIRVTPIAGSGTQHASTVTGAAPAGYSVDTGVLPGTIFAQDYNDGGQGVGYSISAAVAGGTAYRPDGTNLVSTTDTSYGGGLNLTGLSTGDQLNYTVDVLTGGTYDLSARVSSTTGTGRFQVLVDGVPAGGVIPVTSSDGSWVSVADNGVNIPAGAHTITFTVVSAGFDLRYFTASRINEISSGAVIQAEDFGAGGEGVGYHDANPGNSNSTYDGRQLTGYYRGGDVDIQPSSFQTSQADNYDIGSTDNGEWLRYDIHTATAGTFDVGARVASGWTSGKIQYALDSTSNIVSPSTVEVPNTGGWETWMDETQPIAIPAGTHALYVLIQQGGLNFDQLTISPAGQGWAKTVGFGDSSAAGPGVSPSTAPNERGYIKNGLDGSLITCERSRWNTLNYLADELGQRDQFYDASCPGDVSASIAGPTNADGSTSSVGDEIAEATSGYRSSAPGTGALGTGTKVVTVSIGSNDVFASADGSYQGSVSRAIQLCQATTSCVDSTGDPVADPDNGAVKGVRATDISAAAMLKNLRPIVDQIRAAAPNARIRFVGFPAEFGTGSVSCQDPAATPTWAYSTAETGYLQGLINALDDTQKTVIRQLRHAEHLTPSQLDIVDIREASAAHNVCAPLNLRWISQPTGDFSSAPLTPTLSLFAVEEKKVAASLQ